MRLKYNFETIQLDDQIMAVPIDTDVTDFRGVVKMNEMSAFIFDQLKSDTTEESIVNTIKSEYDGSIDQIIDDVKTFISVLKEKGLLIE